MANISYWLTVKVKTGQAPQITHDTPVTLKVFFDENHNDDKNDVKLRVKLYAEYSSITPIRKSSGQQRFDFQITEREYNASTFTLYIWGEPYGYVAFRNNLDKDHRAAGRLRIPSGDCKKGGLIDPPPNSQKDDLQIICECDAVQSVVNYMADEMNNNLNSPLFNDIKSTMDNAKNEKKIEDISPAYRALRETKNPYTVFDPPLITPSVIDDTISRFNFACLVHTNAINSSNFSERLSSETQHVAVCWGKFKTYSSIWDHKPKIYPIWGAKNRLGNADHLFYYDIWSNMHYGFIGKKLGFDDLTLFHGGAYAQRADHKNATDDDPKDKAATKEGIMLSNKEHISIDDLINVVEKHYDWFYIKTEKNNG